MNTKIILKKFFIICALFAATNTFSQNTPEVITLRQSVDVAIAKNLVVAQTDLLLKNAGINLKQSKFNRLPDLGAQLNHGINQGRSIDPGTNSYINEKIIYGYYELGTNVTLFNGSRLRNLVKTLIFC